MTPDKAAKKQLELDLESNVSGQNPAAAAGRKSSLQRGGPYEAAPASKAARVEGAEGMSIDVEGLPAIPVLPGAQNYAATPFTAPGSVPVMGGSSSPGGGANGGGEKKDEETSDMQQVLREMKSLRINVESMLKEQAFHFNEELSKLRAELVSRVEFQGLEQKVQKT